MTTAGVRVYADTSVFGGAFDAAFAEASGRFFELVRRGRFKLVTSAVVQAELESAPGSVRALFEELLRAAEVVEVSAQALELQEAYLRAGIVRRKWSDDALHVALAATSRCPLIVSWNFQHIVHFEKIPLYNGVNRVNGYAAVDIFSPLEVIEYEG